MSKDPVLLCNLGVTDCLLRKAKAVACKLKWSVRDDGVRGPSLPKGGSLPTYWVEVVGLGPLRLRPNFPFLLSKNRRTRRTMAYLWFSSLSSTYTFLSTVVYSWSLPPLALASRTASVMKNSWSRQEENSTTWKVLGEDRSGWLCPEQKGPCSHVFSSLGNKECASIPQSWTFLFFYILHSFLDFTHNLKSLVWKKILVNILSPLFLLLDTKEIEKLIKVSFLISALVPAILRLEQLAKWPLKIVLKLLCSLPISA